MNVTPEKARYRIACMESAFPEAMVTGYEPIIDKMTNHDGDRHVLAAAVIAKADAIVTANSRDFPRDCLRPFGIEKMTPDDFLVHQCHLDKNLVAKKVREQAEGARRSVTSLLDLLSKMTPRFVQLIRPEVE